MNKWCSEDKRERGYKQERDGVLGRGSEWRERRAVGFVARKGGEKGRVCEIKGHF